MIPAASTAWHRPAIILLALLGLSMVMHSRGSLTIAPPAAVSAITPTEQPERLSTPQPAPLQDTNKASRTTSSGSSRIPAATTHDLFVFAGNGTYDDQTALAISAPLQEALGYVEERTGLQLARRVNIVFDRRPTECGPDAVAYTNVRTLILYTCATTPSQRAVNILAHEFVHQLAHDRYGAAHLRADLLLSEGVATWGAGRYWLGGEDSFHDFVAKNYAQALLPLATDPRPGVTTDRLNQLYYQWASYVEWVRATFGPSAFDCLYTAGDGTRPGSAPYTHCLGIDFAESEARWRTWLAQPDPTP